MSGAAVRERLREVESGEWDELLAALGCEDAYLSRAYVESDQFGRTYQCCAPSS